MNNKYEVLGIVGEGAYGIVYKCRNKETNDFVAIKKFKETEDEVVQKSMQRELKVLKILKHENIVEFKEAFKRKGSLFLVFEYVEKNLLELLQEHPKGLDPNCIKKLIYQMCKALKYLNDMGIIHRDIKPENMLIDSNYNLKLCDFGFAKMVPKGAKDLTDYVATRWYRPPELLLISNSYGPEVDFWAVGCIMGELSDGDPLFPGENEFDQLVIIQNMLGKFPDHQLEAFTKVPHFNGKKLIEPKKPMTLERRYMGKLSKTAISFMKALLHPDPKMRLGGEKLFTHPYFESFINTQAQETGSTGAPSFRSRKSEERNNIKKFNLNIERSNSNKKLDEILKKQEEMLSQTKVNFKTIKNQIITKHQVAPTITNINIYNYNIEKDKSPEKLSDFMKTSNFFKVETNFQKFGDKSKSYNNINNDMLKATQKNFNVNKANMINLYKGEKEDMSPMNSLPREDKKKLIPIGKNTFTKVNFYPSNKFSTSLGKTLEESDYQGSPVSIGVKGAPKKYSQNKNNFNNVIMEESEYIDNNKLKKSYFNPKFKGGSNMKNTQLPNITKNYFFK